MRKTHYKKSGVSRTMEWLDLSPKIQTEFSKNFLACEVDYLQYTCYKISEPLKNFYQILGFTGTIDTDNSNVEINEKKNMTLTHNETRLWHAYMLTFLSPWFPPIPIASIEVYNPNKKWAIKSEWKIVFYGAYFVFREIIAEEVDEVIRFHNTVELGTILQTQKSETPVYKRTRVDIAVDVKLPVSQKWLKKYIRPHKNSKQVAKPYNYRPELGGWQSISYIPNIGKGIWIRIYNKILDIRAKRKESWYPNYGNEENPIVTRIELIYGGDAATDTIENLLNYTKFRIMGKNETQIKRKIRPKSVYSPLSAFNYFKRYAKNHGKELHEVLYDITQMLLQEEEKNKDFSNPLINMQAIVI